MFCTKCGNDIPETMRFCKYCGAQNPMAGGQPQAPQYMPPPQQQYAAPPQQIPVPMYIPVPQMQAEPASGGNAVSLVFSLVGALLLFIGYKRLDDTLSMLYHAFADDDYIANAMMMVAGGGACGLLGMIIYACVRRRRRNGVGMAGEVIGCLVLFGAIYLLYHYYQLAQQYS
ncbi:MAG: zinc ribbon domain-containing protein [Oscillospiraceae bacterium]|nr:zinc ribbon domain-containing protein [Oscillospiraceae bacterium]